MCVVLLACPRPQVFLWQHKGSITVTMLSSAGEEVTRTMSDGDMLVIPRGTHFKVDVSRDTARHAAPMPRSLLTDCCAHCTAPGGRCWPCRHQQEGSKPYGTIQRAR